MNKHQEIRDALYEYLAEELDSPSRDRIERHLQSCASCRRDLAILREAFVVLPTPDDDPAGARTPAFWEGFPFRIEQAVRARQQGTWKRVLPHLRDSLLSFAVMRKGQIALAGAATGLCALALALFLRSNPTPVALESTRGTPPPLAEVHPRQPVDTTSPTPLVIPPSRSSAIASTTKIGHERVSDYFRKSKILLIGVANLKDGQDSPPDLSTERSVSRALVREARYLKQEPGLNPKAKELIDELNRILIQLANLSEQNDASGIEIVRGGIRQENLLFKIRMAETAIDAPRPAPVSMKKESSTL